ncbi:chaplin family protein [Actinomadura sp. 9N215]|uniref:chaplin family protein n=1 Tax=Actinomadura sp. 9N215 TaxID=3375150 RepID=UPI003794D241
MRTWAKGTSRAAVLTAGFVALGVSAIPANAFADTTDGGGSVLGGNQIDAPISAPVEASGNGASLIGSSYGISQGGAKVHKRAEGGGRTTSGTGGAASGNQVNAPVAAPVNVCGNGAAVLGRADAGCDGGAKVEDGGTSGQITDGTGGVIAGNQLNAPISIPVNVCGNAVAVVGDTVAGCDGGSLVKNGGQTGSGQETSGLFGVGSGNQAALPISAPVDVCGNAVGNAAASCAGGASVRDGGHRTGRQISDGAFGVIAGNQGNAPISIPLTVCGNAAALAGEAAAFCEGGVHVRSSSGGDQYTSGIGGVLAGNQGNAPVTAPAAACGNAAAVIGLAAALCEGGPGHDDPYPHHRTAGAGEPLPLNPAPLSKGAAVLPILPKVPPSGPVTLPQTDDLPATTGLPKVDGLNSVASSKAQHRTGELPGAVTVPDTKSLKGADLVKVVPGTSTMPSGEGTPVAVSLLGARNLPGDTVLPGTNDRHSPNGVPTADGLLKTNDLPKPDGLPKVSGPSELEGLPNTDALLKDHGLPTTTVLPNPEGLPKPVELPKADVLPKADELSNVDGLPKLLKTDGLPKVDGLLKECGLPMAGGVPGTGRQAPATVLPVQDASLPQVDGPRGVDGPGKGGLPATTEGLLAKGGLPKVPEVKGVPAVDGVPSLAGIGGLPPVKGGSQRGGSMAPLGAGSPLNTKGLPGAGGIADTSGIAGGGSRPVDVVPRASLPVAKKIPGVPGGDVLPAKPVVPTLKTVTAGLPDATGVGSEGPVSEVVPGAGELGPVQQVAADGTITDSAEAGAMWTLVVSGMLAAVSGALALARRIRLARH